MRLYGVSCWKIKKYKIRLFATNHLFGCKYASIWRGCQNLSYVKYHVFNRWVFSFHPFSFLFSSIQFSVFIHSIFCFHPFDFLFSSVRLSVCIRSVFCFHQLFDVVFFCSIIFFVVENTAARQCNAASSQSSLPQLPFLLMDDNALS